MSVKIWPPLESCAPKYLRLAEQNHQMTNKLAWKPRYQKKALPAMGIDVVPLISGLNKEDSA